MEPLTERQRNVLEALERHSREHGFPPTLREIGQAIGLSNVSAVRGHLMAIEKKGYISKDSDKARSIRILHSPSLFSRLKRRLHEMARTDEGVFHHVVYGLALVTRDRLPLFSGARKEDMTHALEKEAVERGWQLVDVKVEPTHVVLVVKVWPNHSPQLVVRRIESAGAALCRRHRGIRPGEKLWARPHVITTDPSELDSLTALLLEEVESGERKAR